MYTMSFEYPAGFPEEPFGDGEVPFPGMPLDAFDYARFTPISEDDSAANTAVAGIQQYPVLLQEGSPPRPLPGARVRRVIGNTTLQLNRVADNVSMWLGWRLLDTTIVRELEAQRYAAEITAVGDYVDAVDNEIVAQAAAILDSANAEYAHFYE